MKDKAKKSTVTFDVDTIVIGGVTRNGMKGKTEDVDLEIVPLLLAHKFIKNPAEVSDHE